MNWPIHRPARRQLRTREAGLAVTNVRPYNEVGIEVAPRGPGLDPAEYDEIYGQQGTAAVPIPREASHPQQHLSPINIERLPHPHERVDSSEALRINPSAGSRIFPRNWPTVTIANQMIALPWWYPISHLLVQNSTTNPLYADFDAQATLGSLVIAVNSVLSIDIRIFNTLTLLSTGAFNINGSATGGIFVAGWV